MKCRISDLLDNILLEMDAKELVKLENTILFDSYIPSIAEEKEESKTKTSRKCPILKMYILSITHSFALTFSNVVMTMTLRKI